MQSDQQPGISPLCPSHHDEWHSLNCESKQALSSLICFYQECCHREEASALACSNVFINMYWVDLIFKVFCWYVCMYSPSHVCMLVYMPSSVLGAQDTVVKKGDQNSTLVEFTISWKRPKENWGWTSTQRYHKHWFSPFLTFLVNTEKSGFCIDTSFLCEVTWNVKAAVLNPKESLRLPPR